MSLPEGQIQTCSIIGRCLEKCAQLLCKYWRGRGVRMSHLIGMAVCKRHDGDAFARHKVLQAGHWVKRECCHCTRPLVEVTVLYLAASPVLLVSMFEWSKNVTRKLDYQVSCKGRVTVLCHTCFARTSPVVLSCNCLQWGVWPTCPFVSAHAHVF